MEEWEGRQGEEGALPRGMGHEAHNLALGPCRLNHRRRKWVFHCDTTVGHSRLGIMLLKKICPSRLDI